MSEASRLYDKVAPWLLQNGQWRDVRHAQTLAWMVVGLLLSGQIALSSWAEHTFSRALYAASRERRLARWLDNERIMINELYLPLIQQSLRQTALPELFVALDTSRLNERLCLIRLSLIYRGRAIPLAWRVVAHASATVSWELIQPVLAQAARTLPSGMVVTLLADRGFVDLAMLRYLRDELGWHWRVRLKRSNWLYWRAGRRCKAGHLTLKAGHACFLHNIAVGAQERVSGVHLAVGTSPTAKESWYVLSDQPTSLATFADYRLRFDIEENFLDDKSNGFQLHKSRLSEPEAMERLCLVLSIATLLLVMLGTELRDAAERRIVDSHWTRGLSYFKLGWKWLRHALMRALPFELATTLDLTPDPEPVRPSARTPTFSFDFARLTTFDWATRPPT